jgi:hypothetical protein
MEWATCSVECVMSDYGFVRWEVEDQVIFEIPADAIASTPQDTAQTNLKKIMVEEPM